MEEYKKEYSEQKFSNKIKSYAQKMGKDLVYRSFLMYYAFQREDTPAWAKRIILGTLGYVIAPIDFIPDLTPLVGYTDDIKVILFATAYLASYINDDVKKQAEERVNKIFNTEIP